MSRLMSMNCLEYALRFWKENPSYKIVYDGNHVINWREADWRGIEESTDEHLDTFPLSDEAREILKEYKQLHKMNFYFTLGHNHTHTIPTPDGDIQWDKDGVVCVQADSESVAIDFIVAMFGQEWSNCYGNLYESFFPKGVIHTYIIPAGTTFEPEEAPAANEV